MNANDELKQLRNVLVNKAMEALEDEDEDHRLTREEAKKLSTMELLEIVSIV